MPRQQFGQPYLVVPAKVFLRVLRKLDVIRRISVNKIAGLQRYLFEIRAHEVPVRECRDVLCEISFVDNLPVPAEGNVELVLPIEPAQTVVTGAIQIIEKACRFLAVRFTLADDLIETLSLRVKVGLLVLHLQADAQTFF